MQRHKVCLCVQLDMSKMEAKIGKFFDSVGSFFTGGDQIPWCDYDIVTVSFLLLIFMPFLFIGTNIAKTCGNDHDVSRV